MYPSALHAEWLKIRTLRSQVVTLAVIPLVTLAFSVLAGRDASGDDPLFSAYFGVSFGQIAAVSFAANAMAAEFRDGALRTSLAAVPDRTRWFAAKATAIALPVLAVGLLTGALSLSTGDGLGWAESFRGAVGCGIYLTLMALLAAGLTAVLRSGVATLGIVVPFLLIVSFVVGDLSGTVADWFPDRAGQAVLHSDPPVDPWAGLSVTALWSGVALGAGVWRVGRRDA
ncbi:ABC transporter permease [Streptomyces sp. NPDC004539]|uniref:ABC transporter permease n=1 Tax=Streptomyces sp. NPDC004539 TaxID=3154280 RepID=UPI0033ACA3FD